MCFRFVRSDFKGQLPKPYSGDRNATWTVPEAMNDMNREEPSRYVSQGGLVVVLNREGLWKLGIPCGGIETCILSHQRVSSCSLIITQFDIEECHFLVDLVTGRHSELEPCYACDKDHWHLVANYPFLDASRSAMFFVAHSSEL